MIVWGAQGYVNFLKLPGDFSLQPELIPTIWCQQCWNLYHYLSSSPVFQNHRFSCLLDLDMDVSQAPQKVKLVSPSSIAPHLYHSSFLRKLPHWPHRHSSPKSGSHPSTLLYLPHSFHLIKHKSMASFQAMCESFSTMSHLGPFSLPWRLQ